MQWAIRNRDPTTRTATGNLILILVVALIKYQSVLFIFRIFKLLYFMAHMYLFEHLPILYIVIFHFQDFELHLVIH